MAELNLGIDDAGRGPLLGPMILAGCLLKPEVEKELKMLGVKDSKDITQKKREFLAEKIIELAESFEVVKVYPDEIEKFLKEGIKLNELEAISMAKIVNKLNSPDKEINLFVDCPSTSISKWQDFLKTQISDLSKLSVKCEHKADQNHVSVSAASILAKCEREKEMDILRKKYGEEIGSGYTSDPVTQKFLEKNAIKLKDTGIFRKTWITYQKAIQGKSQKKLEI